MRRMPLLVATILGGVALIVANPLVGRAAEEDASVCKECTNHSGDEHHFHLGLPTGQHQGLPNAHHLNLQDGSCNNWHNQCTSGQASAFDARFKSIQDFAEELKSMPADDILALQSEFDLFVRVSDDGRQLFLVGCNDQVIAALPVGLQAVSSLASRA